MASNPPFLPAQTASVNWTDTSGTFHLHVFVTDGYTITERYITSGGGWTTGTLTAAAENVSATCWSDSQGGHVRVYATNADTMAEWCLDGNESSSWYQGTFTLT